MSQGSERIDRKGEQEGQQSEQVDLKGRGWGGRVLREQEEKAPLPEFGVTSL